MSPKSNRHKKGKAVDNSGPSEQYSWSIWVRDENGYYYRSRDDGKGGYIYEYFTPSESQPAPPEAFTTPRSGVSSGTVSSDFDSSDTAYHQNSSYRFETSNEGETSNSFGSLTDDFAKTSLSDAQRPLPYTETSYNTSNSDASSAIPISNPARQDGQSYGFSSSAPAASGGIAGADRYSKSDMIQGYQIPEDSTGFYQQNPSRYNTGYGQPSTGALNNKTWEAGGSGADTPKVIHKTISGSEGSELDPSFVVQPSSAFRLGHIFKIVWYEPMGTTSNDNTVTQVTKGEAVDQFGEKIYTSIRRFVIVKNGRGHSQCVPVLTYSHQGARKRGINPEHHAIIHSTPDPPEPKRGENGLKKPIRVKMFTPRDKLEAESRVHYAKIYTVEHNVKVHFIGQLHAGSWGTFFTDFDASWTE